jgi:hypothetical protein
LVHPPTLLPLLLLMMLLPPLEVEVVESIVMLSNDGFQATPLPQLAVYAIVITKNR